MSGLVGSSQSPLFAFQLPPGGIGLTASLTVRAASPGIALYLALGSATASPARWDYCANSNTSLGVVQVHPWDPSFVRAGCTQGCNVSLAVVGAPGR